jgi:hypothetical protein
MRFFLLFLLFAQNAFGQQCNPAGNLWIFSNYDGSLPTVAGRLNIVVDVNVPNIRIGICSYERVTVNITGAFAANVTAVRYAGFNAMGNCNCGNVAGCGNTSIITGVAAGIITYVTYPPASVADVNGNPNIDCAYQCTAGNQGGCNTASQVAHYFGTTLGGTLRAHTIQYGCWAGATHNLSTTGTCCLVVPLGVSLASFDVQQEEQRAHLMWKTDSEINNDYFVVERSTNGQNWEEIDQVAGSGTSTIENTYESFDKLHLNRNTYYRIKQVDFDGAYTYSDIRTIAFKSETFELLFYPNPNNGSLHFVNSHLLSKPIGVQIFDLLGKRVIDKVCAFDNINFTLDLHELTNGTYTIRVENLETNEFYLDKIIVSNNEN